MRDKVVANVRFPASQCDQGYSSKEGIISSQKKDVIAMRR
jgi:hypothetical protein